MVVACEHLAEYCGDHIREALCRGDLMIAGCALAPTSWEPTP